MKKSFRSIAATLAVLALTGCASKVTPTYTSTNTDLLRIGGSKPADKDPVVVNTGTFCLQVQEKWKADGKTPDGLTIWSLDTLRKSASCK
jgi:hypothetical protein